MSAGPRSTRNRRLVAAPAERVYAALTDPAALAGWLPPGGMTGRIHHFDLRVGGGYDMSLYFPANAPAVGKTAEGEDRVRVRFVALEPPRRLVQAAAFVTADPAMKGEMRMIVTLDDAPGGTLVTFAFEDLPPGLRPEDNAAGAEQSLAQLAAHLEQSPDGRMT
jgi:uncharacterized protein YndB with AHSA1/START domain